MSKIRISEDDSEVDSPDVEEKKDSPHFDEKNNPENEKNQEKLNSPTLERDTREPTKDNKAEWEDLEGNTPDNDELEQKNNDNYQMEDKSDNSELSPEEIKYLDENTLGGIEGDRNANPLIDQEDTNGDFHPDGWKEDKLSDGDTIYQLGSKDGTGSNYFTDQKTIDSCKDENGNVDIDKLKDKLQIKEGDVPKDTLRSYTIRNGDVLPCFSGTADVNFNRNQNGGGNQYFIPHATQLKENNILCENRNKDT